MSQDLQFKHTCPHCNSVEECDSKAFISEKTGQLMIFHECSNCGTDWLSKQKIKKDSKS